MHMPILLYPQKFYCTSLKCPLNCPSLGNGQWLTNFDTQFIACLRRMKSFFREMEINRVMILAYIFVDRPCTLTYGLIHVEGEFI